MEESDFDFDSDYDYDSDSAETTSSKAITHNTDRDTDVKNCEESLKIYKGLLWYTKKKFGSKHQDSVQLMRHLGRTHGQTARVILRHLKSSLNQVQDFTDTANTVANWLITIKANKKKKEDKVQDYRNVLQHLRDGLIVNNRILETQLNKNNNYHIPVEKLKTHFIVKDIFLLAFIHNKLGWELPRDDLEKKIHHQDALNIYEKIHPFQKSIGCDQRDELKTVNYIASTYNNLGLCVSRTSTERKSSYRKALEMYKVARELTENIHTSESRDYLQVLLNKADIHFRLHFLTKSDALSQHYQKSIQLFSLVTGSQLDFPGKISYAKKRIASLRNAHSSRKRRGSWNSGSTHQKRGRFL